MTLAEFTQGKRYQPWPRLLAPLGLGACGVFAFAPFELFWLAFLVWGAFFWLLRKSPDARHATITGALFGTGFFLAGVSWVYVSLSVFGGMPFWLAGIATLGFCLLLACFPALLAYLWHRLKAPDILRQALLFAVLQALLDWSRTWVFTGFPWLALGYSQTGWSPLAGWAPLGGVFALSFLTALCAALLLAGRKAWLVIAAFLILSSGLRLVHWTQPMGAPFSVALLQGNVSQEMKWDPTHYQQTLIRYYQLMAAHPAKLTVFPETALPAFVDQLPPDYLEALKTLARKQEGNLILGALTGDPQGYQNSAVSLGSDPAQIYSKSHLVPFGEFIPPGFGAIMSMARIPMSNFTPGTTRQALMALGGQQVAVNICYEDVFGEQIVTALPQATVLVNLSNTAWFGDSLAQAQHLQIAQIRALETGRPMLRATNTGMTAVISPQGEVLATLKPFTTDALVHTIDGYRGETPFARTGNLSILIFLLLVSLPLLRRP